MNDLRDYLALLVGTGRNDEEDLVALASCSYATGDNALYIYMAGILGAARSLSARANQMATPSPSW